METVVIELTEQQMRDVLCVATLRQLDTDQAAQELLTESLVDLLRRAIPTNGGGLGGRVIPFRREGE